MIGFDRSALVAHLTCGTGSQNANRVVVRFMTKVFWSILSKSRTRQARALIFRIITKSNDNKRRHGGASRVPETQGSKVKEWHGHPARGPRSTCACPIELGPYPI